MSCRQAGRFKAAWPAKGRYRTRFGEVAFVMMTGRGRLSQGFSDRGNPQKNIHQVAGGVASGRSRLDRDKLNDRGYRGHAVAVQDE